MIPKIVKYNMGDVFHTLGMKENLSIIENSEDEKKLNLAV